MNGEGMARLGIDGQLPEVTHHSPAIRVVRPLGASMVTPSYPSCSSTHFPICFPLFRTLARPPSLLLSHSFQSNALLKMVDPPDVNPQSGQAFSREKNRVSMMRSTAGGTLHHHLRTFYCRSGVVSDV